MNIRYLIPILFLFVAHNSLYGNDLDQKSLQDTLKRKGVKINKYDQDTIAADLNMETVVVTGTRSKRLIKDTPIQTRVITAEEIRRSGHNKVEDVLSAELPGVEFHQAGYGTTMTFQGLDARHVLVLLDGERISGGTNGNVDFSRIPTENIDKIEIVKGSSSVLYGSSAMGATINVITKRPVKEFEGSVFYSFGGFNQKNSKEVEQGQKADIPNMTAAGYVGFNRKKFLSSTDFTYQSIDPYRLVNKREEKREYITIDGKPANKTIYVPIDSSGISISGWQSFTINQRFEYEVSDKVTAYIKAGYYYKNRHDLGKYNASVTENTAVIPYENYQGFNVDGYVDYQMNTTNHLNFSIHNNYASRDEIDQTMISPKQRNSITTLRVLYNNRDLKKNSITAGIEYVGEFLNLDLTKDGFDKRYKDNTVALYIQDDAQITSRLGGVLGLRFENYGFADSKQFFKNIFGYADQEAPKGTGLSITPQLAVTYKIKRTTLRFNYAMGFRNPSLKERYMSYYQPYMGMTIVGNPDLIPETNNYFSISSDYLSKNNKIYLTANLYANLFRNKIDTYHDSEKLELIYQNTSKSELYGAEISGRIMLLKSWWFNGSYSYNHRVETGPVNSAQYIFTSPHTATISTNYMHQVGKWSIGGNLSLSYFSSKDYEDMMPTIIHYSGTMVPEVIEGVYKGHLEGYLICGLSVNAMFKNRFTITAGVDNLFNYTPTIASFNSAVTPGITGYLSLRYKF